MIAVVDYGAGNLASVVSALERVGACVSVTASRDEILTADGIVVPGVGAAADTMNHLNSLALGPVIRDVIARGIPYLGICMGMQVLMSSSYEGGEHACLDVIRGHVRRLPGGQPIPHMGWNQVWQSKPSSLFDGIPDGAEFYFVHSYYVDPADDECVGARTGYGVSFPCVISQGNLTATQFHPEKSGKWGLTFLSNFVKSVESGSAKVY